jgi:hypothetical protein
MKFRIEREGWVVGLYLIPAGTVLDFAKPDDYTRIAAGHVPPLNATALNQESYDLMRHTYITARGSAGPIPEHRIEVGPGVIRRRS